MGDWLKEHEGILAVVVAVAGLVLATWHHNQTTDAATDTQLTATINDVRGQLVEAARRINEGKFTDFEAHNIRQMVESHLADLATLGKEPHKDHKCLLVNTLNIVGGLEPYPKAHRLVKDTDCG